jgi:hypothetical protein
VPSVFTVSVGDDVDFGTATHGDGDVFEGETGEDDADDEFGGRGAVDCERGAVGFGTVVEDYRRYSVSTTTERKS